MSKLNKVSSPEMSEDDDSFNVPPSSTSHNNSNNESFVLISSDEDTIPYKCIDNYNLSSDDENQDRKSKNSRDYQWSLDKQNVVKKLFSNTNTGTQKTEVLPSTFKQPSFPKMIGGVEVDMPVPPYGCQIALMSKVITGIKKSENCLLESPTGTGKTLALLCSALGWVKHESNRISKIHQDAYMASYAEFKNADMSASSSECVSPSNVSPEKMFTKNTFGTRSIYDSPQSKKSHTVDSTDDAAMKRPSSPNEDIGDDLPSVNLVSIHKRRKLNSDSESSSSSAIPTPEIPCTPEKKTGNVGANVESPNTERIRRLISNLEIQKSMIIGCSVPKIYYGARTHKQLQQVIKEFKRTAYCSQVKMSLLSSREYSCVRDFDKSIYPSKADMCKTCCSNKRVNRKTDDIETDCKYFDGKDKLNHRQLPPAFDLEDLVSKGQELDACPYYAARSMAASSEIVFCPYNYLIDPGIRSNMQINIKDDIIILDEAHNIEDICRDAATFNLKKIDIVTAIQELEVVTGYQYANQDVMDDMIFLMKALNNWVDWFNNQNPLLDMQAVVNKEAVFKWQVVPFVQTLDNHNIGKRNYQDFVLSAERFCGKLREDAAKMFGVSQTTGTLVETISMIYTYLFHDNCKYMGDFSPALIRTIEESYESLPDAYGWRRAQAQKVEKSVVSLRLMCMNPAVVFSGLSSARCILLASGTLAPMISLHSELGAAFPHKVSPKHVIPKERIWVGTLSTTPNGNMLECKKKDTDLCEIQDALGQTVLQVCHVTPHGVLCFLPSYYLLNKLIRRWKETGLWTQMNNTKHVFEENRNAKDHNGIMEGFYEQVETTKGALLFAVYRGKVSEGMDFKDHQARAVITIGIPFPNIADLMVHQKMLYNDKYSKERNILPSKEWLRVQAYRALNQAVGRCVRHRGDWGAVLLVDARFKSNYYTEHLSGWLKDFLGNKHYTYDSLVNSADSLQTFMQSMSIAQDEEDC